MKEIGKSREFVMSLAGLIDLETCLNDLQRNIKEMRESLKDSRDALDRFDSKFGGLKYAEGRLVEEKEGD